MTQQLVKDGQVVVPDHLPEGQKHVHRVFRYTITIDSVVAFEFDGKMLNGYRGVIETWTTLIGLRRPSGGGMILAAWFDAGMNYGVVLDQYGWDE